LAGNWPIAPPMVAPVPASGSNCRHKKFGRGCSAPPAELTCNDPSIF
jgi:hypothetical protein